MRALLEALRRTLAQPLAVADRRRLAAVCIGGLVVVALVLNSVRSDSDPTQSEPEPAQVVDGGQPPAPTATPDPASLPIPEEGEDDSATRADVAAGKRAARAFLRGYLPFANGRGEVDALTHLTEDLREQLRSEPPRRASTWDPDRPPPQIQTMMVTGASATRMGVRVLAVDGDLPISFDLGLGRYEEGWLVTELGS